MRHGHAVTAYVSTFASNWDDSGDSREFELMILAEFQAALADGPGVIPSVPLVMARCISMNGSSVPSRRGTRLGGGSHGPIRRRARSEERRVGKGRRGVS